jgi:hypothetical protein
METKNVEADLISVRNGWYPVSESNPIIKVRTTDNSIFKLSIDKKLLSCLVLGDHYIFTYLPVDNSLVTTNSPFKECNLVIGISILT